MIINNGDDGDNDVDDYKDTDNINDVDSDKICVSDSQQPLAQSPLAPRSCRQPPFISVPSSWIRLQLVIILKISHFSRHRPPG